MNISCLTFFVKLLLTKIFPMIMKVCPLQPLDTTMVKAKFPTWSTASYESRKASLIDYCYGHPRSLEYLFNMLESSIDMMFECILSSLIQKLSDRYKFAGAQYFLRAVIIDRQVYDIDAKIHGTELSFGECVANGYFYNAIDKADIPFITTTFMHGFLRSLGDDDFLNVSKMLAESDLSYQSSAQTLGTAFEIVHGCWECLFRMLLKRCGTDSYCLDDLYPQSNYLHSATTLVNTERRFLCGERPFIYR